MKVIIKDTAKEDIDNIRDYIRNELKNPSAAKNAYAKIRKVFPILGDNPYIGSSLKEKLSRQTKMRYFISENYIIVYSVLEDKKAVLIEHVFGGKQNYIRDIFGE